MAEKTDDGAIRCAKPTSSEQVDATADDTSSVDPSGTKNLPTKEESAKLKDGSRGEKSLSEQSRDEETKMEEAGASDNSDASEGMEDSQHSHTSASGKPDNGSADSIIIIPERFTRSGRKKAIPFPLKLMRVLSIKQYSDVIKWLPAGKSWVIVDTKAFSKRVLPVHFKEAKYSSFTRKLHRWGFQRHLRGEECGAFFHKDFQRGRMDLCEQMTCYKPRPPKMQLSNQLPRGGLPIQAAIPNTTSQMQFSAAPSAPFMNQNPPRHPQLPSRPPQQTVFPPQSIPSRGADISDTAATRRPKRDTMQSSEDVDTLDIAIELEVTRRLRESIQNASSSSSTRPSLPHASQPVPFMPSESHLDLANPRDMDLTASMQSRFPAELRSMPMDHQIRNASMNPMGMPSLRPPNMGVDYIDGRGKVGSVLAVPPAATSHHPTSRSDGRIPGIVAMHEEALDNMKQKMAIQAERLAALQQDAAQLGADRRRIEAERRVVLQQEASQIEAERRGVSMQQSISRLKAERLAALQQDAAQLAADRRGGDMARLEAERRALLQHDAAQIGAERQAAMQQQQMLQKMEAESRAAMQQSMNSGLDTRSSLEEFQAAEARAAIQAAQIQEREECIRREVARRSGLQSLPHSHFDGAKSA